MPPLTSPQIRPAILWGSWVALDGLPFQIPSNGNNFPPSIWMPNIELVKLLDSVFFQVKNMFTFDLFGYEFLWASSSLWR